MLRLLFDEAADLSHPPLEWRGVSPESLPFPFSAGEGDRPVGGGARPDISVVGGGGRGPSQRPGPATRVAGLVTGNGDLNGREKFGVCADDGAIADSIWC